MNCHHSLCFFCYRKISQECEESGKNTLYTIKCPQCRKIDNECTSSLYGIYKLKNIVNPKKGTCLAITTEEETALFELFDIRFNKKISKDHITKNITIAFTSPLSGNMFTLGRVSRIYDDYVYLSDVYLFQRDGKYYNSYPPNRIIQLINGMIIYKEFT